MMQQLVKIRSESDFIKTFSDEITWNALKLRWNDQAFRVEPT